MYIHISLSVKPVSTAHLDQDHLPLADRDFKIKDTSSASERMKLHFWWKDIFLNHDDDIHLLESNLPLYSFPEVHCLPDIMNYFQTCYIPSQRVVVASNQHLLFTITLESINYMLQVQPNPNLDPFSIEWLLELYNSIDEDKAKKVFKNFIVVEEHTPNFNPPYIAPIFSQASKHIITMVSSILGYRTDEHVDEVIFAFISLFTPSKPPTIKFDYAQFIADKMREQLIRLPIERVFKFSTILSYLFLYYQTNKFPMKIRKCDSRGKERFVLYWTPIFQRYSTVSDYKDFVDSLSTQWWICW